MPAASRQRKSDADLVSQNVPKRHRAAVLCAEDELTDEQIAEAVGINRRTLTRWREDPEFAALVGDYHGQIIGQALRLPIAKKHKRIAELNDLNERYWRIIRDRADHYRRNQVACEAPDEALTGLLTEQQKISSGGVTVTDWVFDKSLDSAIKETHKQAATELGQWVEKSEQDQRVGITRRYILEDDE